MPYISAAGVNMTEADCALQERKLDLSYQKDATKISWNHVSLQFWPMTSPIHLVLDYESHSPILIVVCRLFLIFESTQIITFLFLKIYIYNGILQMCEKSG